MNTWRACRDKHNKYSNILNQKDKKIKAKKLYNFVQHHEQKTHTIFYICFIKNERVTNENVQHQNFQKEKSLRERVARTPSVFYHRILSTNHLCTATHVGSKKSKRYYWSLRWTRLVQSHRVAFETKLPHHRRDFL